MSEENLGSDDRVKKFSDFEQSPWHRLSYMDMSEMYMHGICSKCKKLVTVTLTISRREECSATSEEGLIRLKRDKVMEGLELMANHSCEDN